MSNLHICSFLLGTILHCTSWNGLFPVVNWGGGGGRGESFRCYDNSDVVATLMMTNFHFNTTAVAIFQMFVYGDVVYAQTSY